MLAEQHVYDVLLHPNTNAVTVCTQYVDICPKGFLHEHFYHTVVCIVAKPPEDPRHQDKQLENQDAE
jgi:hypothetical protein